MFLLMQYLHYYGCNTPQNYYTFPMLTPLTQIFNFKLELHSVSGIKGTPSTRQKHTSTSQKPNYSAPSAVLLVSGICCCYARASAPETRHPISFFQLGARARPGWPITVLCFNLTSHFTLKK